MTTSPTKWLRKLRRIHRYLGLGIAILLMISSLTGMLLAWKKSVDWIQPPTQRRADTSLSEWLTVSELYAAAEEALVAKYPDQAGNTIDRMDIRPSKGIVKLLFEKQQWEVQLSGTDGEVLSIARRHSDWIESLHDGSIISDTFKLISMNALGVGLMVLIGSGYWLWYGPKRIRRRKRK